jgi:hypothetical protein
VAHPDKVRKFFAASEMEGMLTMTVQGTLEQMRLDQLLKGKAEAVEMNSILAQFISRIQNEFMDRMVRLVGEEFTDADMDELIAFHSSPVAKKLRGWLPELQSEMVTYFSDSETRFEGIILEIIEARN